eukprot:Platyproteum_vivax@DN5758_c1_g1_i1.p1
MHKVALEANPNFDDLAGEHMQHDYHKETVLDTTELPYHEATQHLDDTKLFFENGFDQSQAPSPANENVEQTLPSSLSGPTEEAGQQVEAAQMDVDQLENVPLSIEDGLANYQEQYEGAASSDAGQLHNEGMFKESDGNPYANEMNAVYYESPDAGVELEPHYQETNEVVGAEPLDENNQHPTDQLIYGEREEFPGGARVVQQGGDAYPTDYYESIFEPNRDALERARQRDALERDRQRDALERDRQRDALE